MPTRRRFLAGLVALSPALARADGGRFDPLDDLLAGFVSEFRVPGVALAVAKDGEFVYASGVGFADRDARLEMKHDSLFRIASISKPITAVAVMRLVEKGKLKLDDKVAELLSLTPAGKKPDARWTKVTVRHLLEHRGGWDRGRSGDPMFNPVGIAKEMGVEPPAMPPAIIGHMLRRRLDFEPGSKSAYSNFGYSLLGRVIEKASGESYEEHVKKAVAEPLKMASLRMGKTLEADRAPGEVRYYSRVPATSVMGPGRGKPVDCPYGGFCVEAFDAHGGWVASAPDLLPFADAFADPKRCPLLGAESVETMFARPEGEKGGRYVARGWMVQPEGKGRYYWHGGSIEGFWGELARRADGVTFAVLLNTRDKVNGADPGPVLLSRLHPTLGRVFARK